MPECSAIRKTWSELSTTELYSFLKLRTDVFFVEQRIDIEELDNRDQEPTTEHLWVSDQLGTAAYLRIIQDAEPSYRAARRQFGRVAVRADRRGEGLAQLLVAEVIRLHGAAPMVIHAQEYVVPLYKKFGFEEFGDLYIEAGLSHRMMYRAGTQGSTE